MRRQRGFTLIEIVIAVMITAILFTMAYGAIQQAVGNRERLQQNSARLRAVQYTVRSLVQISRSWHRGRCASRWEMDTSPRCSLVAPT